jgi:hypothetical protein
MEARTRNARGALTDGNVAAALQGASHACRIVWLEQAGPFAPASMIASSIGDARAKRESGGGLRA